MKVRPFLFIFFIYLLSASSQAQNLNDKVLMTVGGRDVQSGEFIRMYKKSLEPGKPVDIDEYLQQFIVFKLKVADALKERLDTSSSFKNELNGYRNQLAQSYLTDNQAKEKLIRRSYERSLSEINAWHILISLPEDAIPSDTLKAWNKATDIRERIIMGESFEQVARGTSDDQSVKLNGGNLGYFTVFQMIMPFEDAAYTLKKGTVSMPVRTPFGYHIIKITDKRQSKGKVRVAHIMKYVPPGTDETETRKAETEINKIYKKLVEGVSFSQMAKEFSDHKESSSTGGELNWFGAGEMISDFSEAAFSISDTGKFTKPVRTVYGWHIIKLLEKKVPGTLDESRSYLESKINQSYLNSISKKSFIDKLKKEYKYRINQNAYNWFLNNTDTLIIQGLKRYDRSGMPKENLYSFANQRFTTTEFASLLEKRGSMVVTDDSSVFINRSIETRVNDHIISYENSILEKKYPEFRYLMNEFYDGILLFEISGKKVWNKVSEDSAGLRNYYETHKNTYLAPRAVDAKIYTLKVPGSEKILASAFKKYSKKGDPDKRISQKFNTKTDTLLVITEGIWHEGDDQEIDKIKWITGSQPMIKNGFPSVIVIKNIIEPVPLKFEEVQGEMMKGYQEFLESEWVKQLKKSYTVKVNELNLDEVKKKLKNE